MIESTNKLELNFKRLSISLQNCLVYKITKKEQINKPASLAISG